MAKQLPKRSTERLHSSASDLKLTDRQRRFVEALAADPERNGTRAALAVGVSAASAHVRASRWLKLAKVRAYLQAVLSEVLEAARSDTAKTMAGLYRALALLSAQADGRVPTSIKNQPRTMPDGREGVLVSETYDMLGACTQLMAFYEAAGQTELSKPK